MTVKSQRRCDDHNPSHSGWPYHSRQSHEPEAQLHPLAHQLGGPPGRPAGPNLPVSHVGNLPSRAEVPGLGSQHGAKALSGEIAALGPGFDH